jgi:hypothetical protein
MAALVSLHLLTSINITRRSAHGTIEERKRTIRTGSLAFALGVVRGDMAETRSVDYWDREEYCTVESRDEAVD